MSVEAEEEGVTIVPCAHPHPIQLTSIQAEGTRELATVPSRTLYLSTALWSSSTAHTSPALLPISQFPLATSNGGIHICLHSHSLRRFLSLLQPIRLHHPLSPILPQGYGGLPFCFFTHPPIQFLSHQLLFPQREMAVEIPTTTLWVFSCLLTHHFPFPTTCI